MGQNKVPLDDGCSTDDNSDTEELPVFDFLQQRPSRLENSSQQPVSSAVVVLGSDSDISSPPSPVPVFLSLRGDQLVEDFPKREITMLSSDSEEEEFVPLSERLKERFTDKQISLNSSAPGRPAIQALANKASNVLQPDEKMSNYFAPSIIHRRPLEAKKHSVVRQVTSTCVWDISDSDEDAVCNLDIQNVHDPSASPHKTCDKNIRSVMAAVVADLSPPKKKTKRSEEELEQARQEALRKKQRLKEQKAEKENLQQQREQERVSKKALVTAVKALRPEECMKHMVVAIDPALLEIEGGGQLLSALQSIECSYMIEGQRIPRCMTWKRKPLRTQVESTVWKDEPNILVQVPLEEFVAMVHAYKQETVGSYTEGQVSLKGFVQDIIHKSEGRTPSLAVVEMEKYFRSQKSHSQKKLRQAVLNEQRGIGNKRRKQKGTEKHLPEISRVDVEEALVDLQLHAGIQVRFLETWKEFADFISMFTKAVAETPFKRDRDKTGFSFYLESDWSGGVKVDRFGKGLLQVWKRQIQQFNRVSPEIASAIVSAYPSPLLLAQAYCKCSFERERENLLAKILVRRGEGVTSTSRRIGPDLSRRIYMQMTSLNPELSLEATV
uniref:Essential meiotic structure-specific endonuclease 1 n=1 Tax=Latimeria chalumnae TaxID=7897 RepID=M3XIM6_LATCH|nr:PREDICTED: crossover junction endonuclease EME1 [Latimeria chalumnae]|eukprot:XP_014346050.1 PREDICTED: crossover junction endonuclease EME1 [Latimeria chalumnae]